MRVLVLFQLLCTTCALAVNSYVDGTCLREEPAPGMLVVTPGSRLTLACNGQVMVDGLKVSVAARRAGRTPNTTTPAASQGPDAKNTSRGLNKTHHAVMETVTKGYSNNHTNVAVTTVTSEKATPTATGLQPTSAKRLVVTKSDWQVKDMDNEAVYEDDEEGGRVKRPQWKMNGRKIYFKDAVFEDNGATLSLPSVSVAHGGRYSCHHTGKSLPSVKVIVAGPPEEPRLSCHKKSPSSKIICEWTPQQPVAVQPRCYLYLSKGLNILFSRLKCSFSAPQMRCQCFLKDIKEEKRVAHMAYLCVTSMAGNATSSLLYFAPLSILRPDPPSAVVVHAVEGQERMLNVSWGFPNSWEPDDRHYELVYEISYRPATDQSLPSQVQEVDKHQSNTIIDVLPGIEYEIKLRTKEEFDGNWSDWSTSVYAQSWTGLLQMVNNNGLPATENPFYEGSGEDIFDDQPFPAASDLEVGTEKLWQHAIWVSALCVLLSLAVSAYAFRHRDRFVSKLRSLHVVTACDAEPTPPAPTSTPQEGHALVPSAPPLYREPSPREVAEEDADEDTEEGRKSKKRSEATYLNNTSYFLVQRDG